MAIYKFQASQDLRKKERRGRGERKETDKQEEEGSRRRSGREGPSQDSMGYLLG